MNKKDIDIGKSILKDLNIGNFNIDLTKVENISNKVAPEVETRRAMLLHARRLGCEKEMLRLLNKYDNLLRNCTNVKERQGIAQLGAYEIGKLLNYTEFAVDGVTVISK